ncbi:DUF3141 domain-containing protein [Achromobacter sp. UMC71]|uniref:DUF3141 domain-containing protein n=1 Tax=Achromobacter sp. UMC71 TaxID=1862320 RepID=UPI001602777B|nr:DUF3141 domain-containing protein [Achromobacter sp. UMC71]MBB1626118.1 3-hydroxyalkanoate synthetase [Achromobacter sp. UMC71]
MAESGNDRVPAPSFNPWTAAYEYAVDAWQRAVLYADVMRQRGNQYHEHMAKRAPNVLSMEYELVLDGRELARPVNYGLLRIKPPDGVVVDPIKRPFLVVDPRAGHGPGIGGFKPESEIGVAVRAGHPCYFATFLPRPMPTQTVEDVMMAEAYFLEEIIARHPDAEGKPVVVANCQAGWQIMMTAAVRPELFGPIIIAGAPLSYWAGWRGMNPMRYSGGLLGGSWLTAMTSDLGNGTFDGAWLVQNFENLNPANTLWSKQYNLYSKVDTEAGRYLSFEKWWGGHVFLNGPEIQYIVDNLFVGNRLSTAGLVTSDGIRIDLRNIRSPIVVFCSKGDNITPPPQALGWIPDLYQDDAEVLAHDQTIVYAVHESIGHLGIFVSGSVARKEHQEFTSNIDMIDVLPPGIYQAEITDKTPETANADLADGNYVLSFEQRKLDDVRAIVDRKEDDDRRFKAVARISDINLGMYRSFVQPWVRALVTPQSAEWSQRLHPLRLPYELVSDRNPLIAPIARVAEQVREHRQPVSPTNPFLIAQEMFSNMIETSLNIFQELRDSADERTFMGVYGSPLVQDLAGLGGKDGLPRRHPGVSPEHRRFMQERAAELRSMLQEGGLRVAAIRMLLYVAGAEGGLDERSFALIRKMRAEAGNAMTLQEFKDMVRDQAMMMRLDSAAVLQTMPTLLEGSPPAAIRDALAAMTHVLEATESLNPAAQQNLAEMERIFETAARRAQQHQPAPKARRAVRAAAAKLETHDVTVPGKTERATARKAAPLKASPKNAAPAKKAAPARVRQPAKDKSA